MAVVGFVAASVTRPILAQAATFDSGTTATVSGSFTSIDRAVAGATFDSDVDVVFSTDTGAFALYAPGRYGAFEEFFDPTADLELLPATPVMMPRVFSVGGGAVYDWLPGPDGFAPTPLSWGSVAGAMQLSAGRLDLEGNFRKLAVRTSAGTVKLAVFDQFMAPLGSWCDVAIDPTAEETVLYQLMDGAFPILTTQASTRLIAQDCVVPIEPEPLAIKQGYFPSARHTRLDGGTLVAWMTPIGNGTTDQLQLFDGAAMDLGPAVLLPAGRNGLGLAAGDLDDDAGSDELCVLIQSTSGAALQLYRRPTGTASLTELAEIARPIGLTAFSSGSPAIADFDGDGDEDVLALHTDGTTHRTVLWRNERIDHDQRRVDLNPVGNGDVTLESVGGSSHLTLPLTVPSVGDYTFDEAVVIVWPMLAPDWGSTQTPEFDETAAHHYGIALSGSSPTITVPIDPSMLSSGGGGNDGVFVEIRLSDSGSGHQYPSRMLAVTSAVLDDRAWLWSSFGGEPTRPVQGGRPTKQVGSIRIIDFPIRPPAGKRPKPGPKTM